MTENLQSYNFTDILFASMGGNLGAATRALGAIVERTVESLEYYGVTGRAGQVVVDLIALRANKEIPPRRILSFI